MKRVLALFLAPSIALGSTTLTDRYGEPLRMRLPGEDVLQQPVPLGAVSPWMVLATLAAEDKRFFHHGGVDLRSIARALWQNTRDGRVVSGGSTLTQQLARLLEPRPKTFRGKVRESLRALRLERRMSKQEILESYLNEVYYGNRCKGVEAAAQSYFGVPAQDLSLAQASLLAGIPKSPTGYNPVVRFEKARERQKTVLNRMRDWGWLTSEGYQEALAEELRVLAPQRPWIAPHFTEYVRTLIPTSPTSPTPPTSVRTTLDAGLQRDLEPLVQSHVARLAKHQVTNAALVVIDNATGEVLAWVGSADFSNEANQGQVDGVVAPRQPGSALKPFLYAFAFSRDMTPATILQDEQINLNGYMPRNYDETFHGPVRAREALACSFNVPAVLIGDRVGIPAFLQILRRFGLKSLSQPAGHYGLGLTLGNGEVTLLELTNAYAALARGGLWMPARLLSGSQGQQIYGDPIARRVMDRESVYLVTDVLSDNMARARAFGLNSPFHLPFAFAAKTGTTKDYRDNWSIGYTPDWTIGVWAGNFDGKPMRKVSGISGAGPLLRDAAIVMEKRFGARSFTMPRGVQEVEVCPESGVLPSVSCPTLMREVFIKGKVPSAICSIHSASSLSRRPATKALAGDPPDRGIEILFPVPGDIFRINPRAPREAQAIRLKARLDHVKNVRWWVNKKALPASNPEPWWTLAPGTHEVRMVAHLANGKRVTRTVSFLVVP